MNLFNKFKDKTIFITLSDKSTYRGVILSQEGDFIEFKTESKIIWFNTQYIIKFVLAD